MDYKNLGWPAILIVWSVSVTFIHREGIFTELSFIITSLDIKQAGIPKQR